MSSTTTSIIPSGTASPSPTPSSTSGNGPTSSPLLFFVALGFGVVFTNLWIIVGVKYCFRYNQRNRAARALAENGEPIDLAQMQRPGRRRREKKLMSMEEVNERFPLTKYKLWRSSREAEGLPAAGGVTTTTERPASIKGDVSSTPHADNVRSPVDNDNANANGNAAVTETQPPTVLSIAQQDHANAMTNVPLDEPASSTDKSPEKFVVERTETAETMTTLGNPRNGSLATVDEDEDEDDPIRTAAPPEMLAAPGDTCAICIDNLDDDDDVRGLTCGHAFHAACVDPWLTGRRACCPLCKADYYVPKPRNEEDSQPMFGGRRSMNMRLPASPPPIWLNPRAARLQHRLVLTGPRMFVADFGDRTYSGHAAAQQRQQERTSAPGTESEAEQGSGARSWRSRLPAMPSSFVPRFGRRGQQESGEPASTEQPTAADLEAGVRR